MIFSLICLRGSMILELFIMTEIFLIINVRVADSLRSSLLIS